jgi:hypothetical protein
MNSISGVKRNEGCWPEIDFVVYSKITYFILALQKCKMYKATSNEIAILKNKYKIMFGFIYEYYEVFWLKQDLQCYMTFQNVWLRIIIMSTVMCFTEETLMSYFTFV